jgi:hypothetical protein
VAIAILAARAGLAIMLLIAGGAKLADLDGFAASVRLFAPPGWSASAAAARRAALAVAIGELGLGATSLAWPEAGWPNLAVLAACCGFAVVAGAGYAFHRGRSCRCFGPLSRRRFDRAGLARSVAVAAVAGIAAAGQAASVVPSSAVALSPADRLLLSAGAALITFVARAAARSLAASRAALPGMVP